MKKKVDLKGSQDVVLLFSKAGGCLLLHVFILVHLCKSFEVKLLHGTRTAVITDDKSSFSQCFVFAVGFCLCDHCRFDSFHKCKPLNRTLDE